jgi:uncharacterized protein (DUF885 family)
MNGKLFFFTVFFPLLFVAQDKDFEKIYRDFAKGYSSLSIPQTDLDYSVNFSNIAADPVLNAQEVFFQDYKKRIKEIDFTKLDTENKIRFKQLYYEISENLERIYLEKKWNATSKIIPSNGLHSLKNYKDWYSYYVKHFTGVDIDPSEVYKIGLNEVEKAKGEIKAIQLALGYEQDSSFYSDLANERFFIRSKSEILKEFARIDSTVRKNLGSVFHFMDIPRIEAMEWPGASASTPPGIYLNKSNNPYRVDVFQFNFSTGHYNSRCMDWLYMHEAIPGHHLQSIMRGDEDLYFYFGTTEGWACYVEDLGKEMGLYTNMYSLLGKHQWNLVRSARLVMEVGIHYYGWTFERASEYWNANINGQDEIRDREIRRITKWPGQSLCYKVGAITIKKILDEKMKGGTSIKDAHRFILEHSQFPLYALV